MAADVADKFAPTIRQHAAMFLGALLAVATAFFGCARHTENNSQTLRISQRNEPADLDPATASLPDEFFVIRALSEGLLVPNPAGGAPLPAAAERFEVSPDGLTYTFYLRSDAHWSNGEPVIAADFVSSFQRVLTPSIAAPKAHLFFAVKNARAFASGAITDFDAVGIRAADARTVVVTLAKPMTQFPLYVASGAWIPVNPRAVTQHGRNWTQPEHYVGNGPFTLVEWRPQQRIVVTKNARYRDAGHVRLDRIEFIRFDSEDTEDRAFRAGQVDVTMSVPKSKIEAYAHERPADLHRAPLAETRFLSFNTMRSPLDDPRVRRSLALAIDRRKIVERVLHGGQQPATRFLSPALGLTDSPPKDATLDYRPDEARQLLAAAGFPGGKGFPRLELTGWSTSPVLEAIQEMWRQELGIDVAVAVHEAKIHLAALQAGTYDIAFVTTILDVADPIAVLSDFTTAAPNNFPHWHSAEYDRLLNTAAAQRDWHDAALTTVSAETLLLRAAAIAPIYFNAQNWLMSPRVRGWQQDPLWTRCYHDISLDPK
jgi:oligopeptide transport system substrate-binding protein